MHLQGILRILRCDAPTHAADNNKMTPSRHEVRLVLRYGRWWFDRHCGFAWVLEQLASASNGAVRSYDSQKTTRRNRQMIT